MHTELRHFLTRLMAVVAISLLPVVLTAFVTMPWNLGRHPVESATSGTVLLRHMT